MLTMAKSESGNFKSFVALNYELQLIFGPSYTFIFYKWTVKKIRPQSKPPHASELKNINIAVQKGIS